MAVDLKASIDVACPHCGQAQKQTLARLKENPALACVSCGKSFDVEGSAAVDALQKVVSDSKQKFGRTIAGLNKRLKR